MNMSTPKDGGRPPPDGNCKVSKECCNICNKKRTGGELLPVLFYQLANQLASAFNTVMAMLITIVHVFLLSVFISCLSVLFVVAATIHKPVALSFHP